MHVLKHSQRNNGHVHVAVDLACAQAQSGHSVTFASGPGSFDSVLTDHGVRVLALRGTDTKRGAGLSLLDLRRAARRERPDVIHAHMMSSAVLAFPISKMFSAPLVTTVHNSFDDHSTLMRLGKVVVAVSEAERRLLIDRGFPERKVIAVLNGAVASPRQLADDDAVDVKIARPCIMSVSGLHPRKAVDDIVEAFGRLSQDFPHWHLNIVGSGPSEAALRQLVARRGLQDSVHFIGPVRSPMPLLSKAAIFVSASLAEPCGLVNIEARAAGCAVVATAVGGVPEVLAHGSAGQLVPPASPEALAGTLRSLMEDERDLARWQRKAIENIDHLTVRRAADDYEAVYRSVL